MKQVSRVFGVLLFVSLVMVKVTALHVYSHEEDNIDSIEHCQICHVLIESQSDEVIIIGSFVELSFYETDSKPYQKNYEQPLIVDRQITLHCISRPPPSLLI